MMIREPDNTRCVTVRMTIDTLPVLRNITEDALAIAHEPMADDLALREAIHVLANAITEIADASH